MLVGGQPVAHAPAVAEPCALSVVALGEQVSRRQVEGEGFGQRLVGRLGTGERQRQVDQVAGPAQSACDLGLADAQLGQPRFDPGLALGRVGRNQGWGG